MTLTPQIRWFQITRRRRMAVLSYATLLYLRFISGYRYTVVNRNKKPYFEVERISIKINDIGNKKVISLVIFTNEKKQIKNSVNNIIIMNGYILFSYYMYMYSKSKGEINNMKI